MPLDFRYPNDRLTGKISMRIGSAWALCVLLLVFCTTARRARYEIQQHSQKLATTQTYLDGEETLRKLPKTSFRLLSCAGVLAGPVTAAEHEAQLPVMGRSSSSFQGFDHASRPRSPPVPEISRHAV